MHLSRVAIAACVACTLTACQSAPAPHPPHPPAPRRRLRRPDHQRPDRRRHRRAVVPRRRRHHRRSHRGDRAAVRTRGAHPHRRLEPGGRARLHRHARPVGVQRAGRCARGQQDHAGHHHRDHRRGLVDRAAQRRAGEVGAAVVRPLQGGARFPDARRVLRAAREEPPGDQRRHLRRRRRPARLRDGRGPKGGDRVRPRRDEAAGRPGDAARRARSQHFAAVRAGTLCHHRRDRRARQGRQAARRHLHLASALGVGADHPVARRSVRGRRARRHSRRGLAPQDRLQGELGPHAGSVEALRRRPRARPRRHRQHVSLRSRLERPRRLPAAVGARRRART